MKKTPILALLLFLVVCLSSLSACSSRNLQEELPGDWFVWHWYYNEEGADNGFFEEAVFYSFTDGQMSVTDKDGNVTQEATYEFTGKDTLDVTYSDGTIDSFQLLESERDGVKQIQFMNTATKYTLTLEPISSWTEQE